MKETTVPVNRVRKILAAASKTRAVVIGDVMLDHFIWGDVARISPEAPVPVVDFQSESLVPGGAANVARNLAALGMPADLFGAVGHDASASSLKQLLAEQKIGCDGLLASNGRFTSVKTRIIAQQQQIVRFDRETRAALDGGMERRLLQTLEQKLEGVTSIIVGDYGKGVVTQDLLEELKKMCRSRAIWLSLDPKPVHHLNLTGLSLITPNRKEAFELAGIPDSTKNRSPLKDPNLMAVVKKLLAELHPVHLLVTLGELGMLLCREQHKPFHIPTKAKEVFDVSGAGDTVIATFTLAIAAGASPEEAAIISNHAAGIVVGKVGTAVTSPAELIASFNGNRRP